MKPAAFRKLVSYDLVDSDEPSKVIGQVTQIEQRPNKYQMHYLVRDGLESRRKYLGVSHSLVSAREVVELHHQMEPSHDA